MLKHRVIPCLLLKDRGLVKTRRFTSPAYVGDPINAIRIFNDKEADELIVLDISASREGRQPDYAAIQEFAGECFMPLAYGGGISTVEHARRLFSLGVEKVCIQTAALADSTFLSRLAERFGSQAVVASIDVKRNWRGQPQLYRAAKGKTTGRPWLEYLQACVDAGVGEILLTAVDRDGQMRGMDLELIRLASTAAPVPVTASGGAGSLDHIREAVQAGASAVAAGALFVFHGPHRAVLITYPRYDELEALVGAR